MALPAAVRADQMWLGADCLRIMVDGEGSLPRSQIARNGLGDSDQVRAARAM
jgi:hypothetical protein